MLRDNDLILIAEDDENDAALITRAFMKNGFTGKFEIVHDGEEAIQYLRGEGKYCDRNRYGFPSLIITDLRMPRKTGFDILKWLDDHPECSVIPTIVLSSSAQPEDVKKAYQLGVNSYFSKPPDVEGLQKLVCDICYYWGISERPKVEKQKC